MSSRLPKDTRNPMWSEMEAEIQRRAKKKDATFRLSGVWKQLYKRQGRYTVYAVDGAWIRNNLCSYFGHGGHGFVHEFIPKDEIWVSIQHYADSLWEGACCGCTVRRQKQVVSKNYFESTLIHEMAECESMKKGTPFWQAHQDAVQKEIAAGLLGNDPFDDTGENGGPFTFFHT